MINITCNNCEQVVSEYLCDLPSEWRKQITKVICQTLTSQTTIDCEDIKNCETVTSLSGFSVQGTEVCITYKDEKGISFVRCFNWNDVQNSTLDDVDPRCITSQEIWDDMSYAERIQAIIDFACDCAITTTTTTTTSSTTTTTSSTTTTTTLP